ncbi:MAG: PQQ-binding-like beta-propeller repeat protein [Polyangiales bacterium]
MIDRYRTKSAPLLALALTLAFLTSVGCANGSSNSVQREVPEDLTQWAPVGPRTVGDYDYDVIPEPNAFHTMHAGPNNTDNVWVALAPQVELDWISETNFYVPEGPTYDNEGNLYFSPLFPQLPAFDISLISLDATGARNWEIPGDGLNAGSGAVLILNDPENLGEQIIYHATYTEGMAIKPDGTILWRKPTGLILPDVIPGVRTPAHSFGFNYHPRTDSLVGVTIAGDIFAFDRKTGEVTAPLGKVPGEPAVSNDIGLPDFVVNASNAITDAVFGKTPSGASFYETIVDVIFGGGSIVTNYFAIDQNTSRIYVAATAPDEDDGTVDGLSELGAIYALDLLDDGAGGLEFSVLDSAQFEGGTGSTPAVSEDGQRVYVSDNVGNVITYDSELNEIWRFDLGSEIAASVAVSPDNDELYVVTRRDVFKLIDEGDRATLDWTATLEAFEGDPEIDVVFQALTPTITANGVAVSVGGGKLLGDRAIMLRVGVGLLDRETGVLRSFTEGREESIAVTTVSPNGSICTANSPVRRASGKALYDELTQDITGGISCYKPVRNDLLVQEATCAAGVRLRNAATVSESAPASAERDVRQVQLLIEQSRAALDRAVSDGDLTQAAATAFDAQLDRAESELGDGGLSEAANELLSVCNAL